MVQVIDCFMFFNEIDLLEIRLNSLAPYVKRFVLCEMPITHSGKPKPLFFQDNKDRFKEFNITYLVAPPREGSSWKLEHYQRDYLLNGITDVDPDDIMLISDMDEIPDLSKYHVGDEGVFRQSMYYYYFNVYVSGSWKGTIAKKRKNLANFNDIRNLRNRMPTIVKQGGWHFSTMGTAENIKYKIESFAHIELDKPEFKSRIEENRKNLVDPYNRGAPNWGERGLKLIVQMPSGPQWLLENRAKYEHLFWKSDAQQ